MAEKELTFFYPTETVQQAFLEMREGLPVVYYDEDGNRTQIGVTGKPEAVEGGLSIKARTGGTDGKGEG